MKHSAGRYGLGYMLLLTRGVSYVLSPAMGPVMEPKLGLRFSERQAHQHQSFMEAHGMANAEHV